MLAMKEKSWLAARERELSFWKEIEEAATFHK